MCFLIEVDLFHPVTNLFGTNHWRQNGRQKRQKLEKDAPERLRASNKNYKPFKLLAPNLK